MHYSSSRPPLAADPNLGAVMLAVAPHHGVRAKEIRLPFELRLNGSLVAFDFRSADWIDHSCHESLPLLPSGCRAPDDMLHPVRSPVSKPYCLLLVVVAPVVSACASWRCWRSVGNVFVINVRTS